MPEDKTDHGSYFEGIKTRRDKKRKEITSKKRDDGTGDAKTSR